MIGYYADWAWKGRRSIELLLVLPGSLRLLAALHAGTLVVLTLTHLGQHPGLGATTLKTLQRALQRLILPDMDFRHYCFPSLRSDKPSLPRKGHSYGFNSSIICNFISIVKRTFSSPFYDRFYQQDFLWAAPSCGTIGRTNDH